MLHDIIENLHSVVCLKILRLHVVGIFHLQSHRTRCVTRSAVVTFLRSPLIRFDFLAIIEFPCSLTRFHNLVDIGENRQSREQCYDERRGDNYIQERVIMSNNRYD